MENIKFGRVYKVLDRMGEYFMTDNLKYLPVELVSLASLKDHLASRRPDIPRKVSAEQSVKKKLKVAETGTNLFIEDMTKLLEDPETSDFTLKCGSKNFKVHKAILGARSKVFRTMFLSGMKEAVEGEAVITDVDEKTIEETLYYRVRAGGPQGHDL